jgi:two-component system sensor histidine kinase AtoS
MTILENVYTGRMPGFFISHRDLRRLESECSELFLSFGLEIDPHASVDSLSEGKQQIVELVRVLARGTEILILDEISRRLTPAELDRVFGILRKVRDEGKAIIYVTSMIDEVIKIADRVTVLKDGHRRSTDSVGSVDRSRLINLAYSFAVSSDEKADERGKLLLLSRYDESLIRDLPVGLLLLDMELKVALSNASANRALDLPRGIESGSSFLELIEEHGLELREEVEDALDRRESRSWANLRMDNSRIVKLRTFPLNEEDGTPTGTAILIEDISIDHITREYLSRAEKIASTAELAAGVAHEINNPLGIVKNYVEYLKLKNKDDDDSLVLGSMEKELDRIVEIVSSLLSFSRVQQRTTRDVDLGILLDELLILLDHKLVAKRIKLVRLFSAESPTVEAYENRLRQLFLNLITNAIEAVLEDGHITVSVTPSEGGRSVSVMIEDNGCGIPPDIAGEIFKPFYTTKMTKTNTGLGLSICQHIAELHHGVITFDSVAGQGTTFTVMLPKGD